MIPAVDKKSTAWERMIRRRELGPIRPYSMKRAGLLHSEVDDVDRCIDITVVGLARTLEVVGTVDASQMLNNVYSGFTTSMEANIKRKLTRNLDPAKADELRALNDAQAARVKTAFAM